MEKRRTPEGSSVLCPCFSVSDVEEQVAFMEKVFDARIREADRDEDGRMRHVEIRVADTIVMISRASEEWPAYASCLFLYVEDVDVYYRRALDCGAVSILPPEIRPYGMRTGGFRDKEGNQWWVGELMAEV